MSIPSDISSYLTPDEQTLRIEKTSQWEIFATNKRVIFKKRGVLGKEIVEVSYCHISSIEFKKESSGSYILAGIIAIFLSFFIQDLSNYLPDFYTDLALPILLISFGLGIIGVASIIAAFFIAPNFLIHIVGRQPIKISGKNLEEIIKIIRQYREKVEAEISQK